MILIVHARINTQIHQKVRVPRELAGVAKPIPTRRYKSQRTKRPVSMRADRLHHGCDGSLLLHSKQKASFRIRALYRLHPMDRQVQVCLAHAVSAEHRTSLSNDPYPRTPMSILYSHPTLRQRRPYPVDLLQATRGPNHYGIEQLIA